MRFFCAQKILRYSLKNVIIDPEVECKIGSFCKKGV